MASSEHSSCHGSGSIGSRPPSMAPSRESSILSTPPTETSQPRSKNDNNVEIPKSRTPSGSPPNAPASIAMPLHPPMPMPAVSRRVSQLSNSSESSAYLKSNLSLNSNPNANPTPDLPLLQVIDQSGNEVIDPTLRDEVIPPLNPMNASTDQLLNEGVSLPPLGGDIQILNPQTTKAGDKSDNYPSIQVQGQANGPAQGQHPSLPLTHWPSLPSLNLYSSSGSNRSGSGGDTQPSTQTNSPTSPTQANNGLWATSYESLNGSLTDLGSNFGNGDYTTDQGLSDNENYSEGAFEFDNNNHGNGNGKVNGDDDTGAGVPAPKKKSHARKQPEGHIKRARNAFILFRKHITDSNLIPSSVEVKHQNISVVAAKMWKEAPLEVRAKFNEQARIEKEEHAKKYPGYRYQPVFRRTDIIRRRVRKDPAEDEKVDAVAEALIKGKSGNKLEEEIKEQIIQKGNESDVASETSSSSRSRSRRRRDVGQLSKGAIRAQKAQARAKQMRQNLLGTNLLNMSLYNAATNRLASHPSNPNPNASAHYHHQQGYGGYPDPAQYASMYGNGAGGGQMEGYMQIGYDVDGRPIHQLVSQHQGYPGEVYAGASGQVGYLPEGVMGQENEMYRLPPIEGMMDINGGAGAYENWQTQAQAQAGAQMGSSQTQGIGVIPPPGGTEYWENQGLHGLSQQQLENGYDDNQGLNVRDEDYYNSSYGDLTNQPSIPGIDNTDPNNTGLEYRLPPLMDISRHNPANANAHPSSDGVNDILGNGNERPSDLIASQYIRERNTTSGVKDVGERPKDSLGSKDGQQTPSGHVMFNERLFDGALGTAGLNATSSSSSSSNDQRRGSELPSNGLDDDELGMFDQAMEQAGSSGW